MAHFAQHLKPQPAIYSPSVARAAASSAKDWAYIDGWIKTKYNGQKVAPFERSADTLKALLALAAHNEAADEERDQLAHIELAALREVKTTDAETAEQRKDYEAADVNRPLDAELIAEDILQAIETGLTKEGKAALEAMASMAVELGVAYPTAADLGYKFVELRGRSFELQQTTERVTMLQKYLDREAATVTNFLQELHGEEYQTPAGIAKQNAELQQQIDALKTQLPEMQQRISALASSGSLPKSTVEKVRKDEEDYLHLLSKKKDLDAQLKAFAGLPPDLEAARAEVEALRIKLRTATNRRDAGWEGLVERESPFKPRNQRPL